MTRKTAVKWLHGMKNGTYPHTIGRSLPRISSVLPDYVLRSLPDLYATNKRGTLKAANWFIELGEALRSKR